LLSETECKAIQSALDSIAKDVEQGTFQIEDGIEDVHSQIEFDLVKQLGDIGKKIHTGRSRNDQSLLDIKLFIKEELRAILFSIDARLYAYAIGNALIIWFMAFRICRKLE
jgi:argininosuccinate lyase